MPNQGKQSVGSSVEFKPGVVIENLAKKSEAESEAADGSKDLGLGVVVENVTKNAEAWKAGLQEGDVLLRWSWDVSGGEIQSPFDVLALESEQRPRGAVTIEGLRGTERRAWTLGLDAWYLETRPNFSGTLRSVYLEARQTAKAGDLVKAAELWRSAKEQKSGPAWLAPWLQLQVADSLAKANQWKEADQVYEKTAQQAEVAGPIVASQFFKLWAGTFWARNQWDNAEKYYQKAAEIAQESGAYLAQAGCLNNIGLMGFNRGDLAKAQKYYSQSLEIKQKIVPSSPYVAGTLNNLGNVAASRGDPGKAEKYWSEALAIKSKFSPGSLDVASTLVNLGILADDRGDLDKAEAYYIQSLAIQTKLNPLGAGAATSLKNLGLVFRERGDLERAEEYLLRSLAIWDKNDPDGLDVAKAVNDLGLVAMDRGELEKAEEYFRRAASINEKLAPDSIGLATNLINLGTIDLGRKDPARAEQHLQRSWAILEKQSPEGLEAATTLAELGDLALYRDDLPKAEELHRRALAIREKLAPRSTIHAETLAALASVARRKGQPEAAASLYEQALNALEGQTARMGGGEDVRTGFRAKHADYYHEYIDLLIEQKQPALAFQVLERSRARTLLETLAAGHIDIRKGVDPGLLERERSLQATIKAKSSLRMELLTGKHTDEQVATSDDEIKELLSQYQEVEGRIRTSSPSYAALTQPQPLNAKQVQEQLLDGDTLLLEYSLGEDRSYLFALTASSLNSYELPKRAEIDGRVMRLYELLTARNHFVQNEGPRARQERVTQSDAEYRSEAAALSQMLLGPVASQLDRKRLLIVSDGILHYVAFAALPAPGTSGQDLPAPLPLMTTHEIVGLPSASVIAVLRQEQPDRKQPLQQVAVLADPVFDVRDARVRSKPLSAGSTALPVTLRSKVQSESAPHFVAALTRSFADANLGGDGELHLSRLPFTRDEAAAILATVPRKTAMEALDFDASRKLATSGELANYRIVHFATHAVVDNIYPELSGLVLSLVDQKGERQDGFLELQDIYNLTLPVELVVLSSCQTALGKRVDGEGMIGLARGFMYAGTPRVVSTLWKVDDFATAKLMAHFYKALEQDGMKPAQALRQAQLAMSKEQRWAAPYYWAGFILQGEWN
jgi:CHAT domain-containing protein/tetratricopeptide (TPR) repeat protein